MLFNVIFKFKTFEVHAFIYILFVYFYLHTCYKSIYICIYLFTTRCGAAGLRITVIALFLLLKAHLDVLFVLLYCFVCCDGWINNNNNNNNNNNTIAYGG